MACTVTVTNGPMEQGEIQAYIDRAKEKFGREPKSIDIKVCGDEVELNYDFGPQKFHRIRRITGYLVGTLDRFNNGKRAEEHDRVKHEVQSRRSSAEKEERKKRWFSTMSEKQKTPDLFRRFSFELYTLILHENGSKRG